MRRILTTLLALTVIALMPVTAQTTAQSKSRMAYIRKVYQAAQENAKKSADNMVSVTKRDKNERGLTLTTLDFFYVTDVIEGPDIPYCKLNLLRSNRKGQNNEYEEFLYDPDSEDLLFYFTTFEQEKGVKCETRVYMGAADDGTILKISKYTDTRTGKDVSDKFKDFIGMSWDEGFLLRYAHDMQEAFNHLTLRGWD